MEAEKAIITVELKGDAEDAEVEAQIWQDPRVKETDYVTAEASLKKLFERYVPNPEALQYLDENPLPDSIRVRPSSPGEIDELAAGIGKIDGVERVRYGKEVVSKILMLARSIQVSGAALLVLMAFGMVLIVNATIRLTIYARRREIRIMQLVGATNAFVKIPFVCEGLFHGLMGGIFAASVVLLVYLEVLRYVDANLAFIQLIYSAKFLVLFGVGTVLLGIVVGGTGSALSMRGYLRLA
jgi:cell division transport system permease protein